MSIQKFENEIYFQAYLEKNWADNVGALQAEHGQVYFDQLARSLGTLFGAGRIYVASYDLELKFGTTIAEYCSGHLADSYEFYIPGTANEDIAAGKSILIPDGLTESYPKDESIARYKGMIGRPVCDEVGKVTGVIAILFEEAIVFPEVSDSILDQFLDRVSTEMVSFYKNHKLNEINHQLLRDLAVSHQVREDLSRLAYIDRVTGLPNREQFMVDIKMYRDLSNYWIALSGIDCFKPVNDSLGLESGDELLREVGQGIANLNILGTRVYRWIGDEFLMLGFSEQESDIEEKIELCDLIFQRPIEVNHSRVRITRSTGITQLRDHDTIDAAISSVSIAMQKAKKLGGNRVVFYDRSLDVDQTHFFKVHSMIQEGITRHQFVPHYQPIFDPRREEYVGYEALMRWIDTASKTIFDPNQFIPIAERTGLIVELGKQMITAAVADIARWNAVFKIERDLSINLSATQFHDENLISDIDRITRQSEIDPCLITFEITELLLVNGGEKVLGKLQDLKAMGCRLSLDDFGTGYSSLAYLQKYPFDIIKVDRCFVEDVVYSTKSKSLINALRLLATDLGMKITAEGVETQDQSDCLAMMGVDYLQGFYFSKPIPASDIDDVYRGKAVFGKPLTGRPQIDGSSSINLH